MMAYYLIPSPPSRRSGRLGPPSPLQPLDLRRRHPQAPDPCVFIPGLPQNPEGSPNPPRLSEVGAIGMVVGGRRHRCINAGLRPVEIVSLTAGLEWGESGSSVFISI